MQEGIAMADVTRREFLKVTGASLAGSSLVLLGFSPTAALAEVREFKLARATETRNTCPYCAVACGVLMYSLGDRAKNARSSIFHIEGDPDRSEEHTSELQSQSNLVCRLLLEKKKNQTRYSSSTVRPRTCALRRSNSLCHLHSSPQRSVPVPH